MELGGGRGTERFYPLIGPRGRMHATPCCARGRACWLTGSFPIGLPRRSEQLEAPENKENPDGQRPIAAGPIFECFAQGARSGLHLSGQRNQTSGSDRLI